MPRGTRIAVVVAVAALVIGLFFVTQRGKVKGLFETADAEIDTVASLEEAPADRVAEAEREQFQRQLQKDLEAQANLIQGTEPTPGAAMGSSFDLDSILGGGAGGAPVVADPSAGLNMRVPARGRMGWEGKGTEATPAPTPSPKKSGYLSSEYVGGSGQLDRMAKLVDEGIVLDGRTVKLGALTASYHQPIAVPADRALVAFANPEHTSVSTEGGTTHLQVGIQAANRELPKRPAVQIVLVIDTSGSMESERKMVHAREAAHELIDKLLPTDQIALLTYADDATLSLPLQPRGDGSAAHAVVNGIAAGGSTNISGALEMAYEHLGSKRDKDAISRIVLLSDGNPTAGVTDPSFIRNQAYDAFQNGLQTTTLGVGLDFNGELMMSLAREGKGNYHFVKDGDAIAGVLDEELDQLTHVVAQAVRLRIMLPDDVGLVRVLGAQVLDEAQGQKVRREEERLDKRIADELGIAEDRKEDDDEGLKLVVPAFHMGKHHIVMLQLEVPPGADPVDVATVEVKYKDLLSRTNREDTITATVRRAGSKADAIASLDKRVKKNLLGFQTGEALLRAGTFVERGFVDRAVQEIDDQMALLGVAAERWRDSDLERDVELLGAYKEVIQAQRGGGLGPQARNYLSRALSYNGYKLTR